MNKHMEKYPPRPRLNDEIRAKAAERWTEEYEDAASEDELEEIREVLAMAGRTLDGFELGKMIENKKSACVDFQLCEALDGFQNILGNILREAEKEWANVNRIEPPYPAGTRVTFRYGQEEGIGVVHRVYRNLPATYCIAAETPKVVGTRLVRFEDVEAIGEEA